MLAGGVLLLLAAAAYMALLFAIASFGDRRAAAGRSLIDSSVVYALSLAVYCTSWTFYGSVGRAASRGLDFLPIYLGPTLVFCLGAGLESASHHFDRRPARFPVREKRSGRRTRHHHSGDRQRSVYRAAAQGRVDEPESAARVPGELWHSRRRWNERAV